MPDLRLKCCKCHFAVADLVSIKLSYDGEIGAQVSSQLAEVASHLVAVDEDDRRRVDAREHPRPLAVQPRSKLRAAVALLKLADVEVRRDDRQTVAQPPCKVRRRLVASKQRRVVVAARR